MNGYALVTNSSNKVLSGTGVDWSTLRYGSFIQFGDDKVLYNVYNATVISIVKEFETIGVRSIKIDPEIADFLTVMDEVLLSYKSFTFGNLFAIPMGGTGYRRNEIVCVIGGIPSHDCSSGVPRPATFRVDKVDWNGAIKQLTVVEPGDYIQPPPGGFEVAGLNGTGAVLEGEFRLADRRGRIERRVDWVNPRGTGEILLDYNLPAGLERGNITFTKYEMLLTGPYLGESSRCITFNLQRDITPTLHLPLLSSNPRTLELFYNAALMKLDAEISSLKEEIQNLKRGGQATHSDASPE